MGNVISLVERALMEVTDANAAPMREKMAKAEGLIRLRQLHGVIKTGLEHGEHDRDGKDVARVGEHDQHLPIEDSGESDKAQQGNDMQHDNEGAG